MNERTTNNLGGAERFREYTQAEAQQSAIDMIVLVESGRGEQLFNSNGSIQFTNQVGLIYRKLAASVPHREPTSPGGPTREGTDREYCGETLQEIKSMFDTHWTELPKEVVSESVLTLSRMFLNERTGQKF